MRSSVNYLLSIAYLFLFSHFANSTNYYVNNSSLSGDIYCTAIGNNSNNGLTPSMPKATLTNVLSTYAASFSSGDTIFVDSGTFSDNNMSSPANGVVIKGAGNNLTIFDNNCADCYFMYINDNNTQLIGMKLFDYNNQTGPDGQVLGITSATTGVKITNVLVTGSSTTSSAAEFPIAVWSGAQVTFTGGGSTCNNWDGGGGIYVTGATTNVTINNYLFVGNYQLFASPSCSGLWVANGTVTVNNSRFESNLVNGSTFVGSAIYVTGGNVKVNDCVLNGNKSYLSNNSTGGTILVSGGTFRIARSIISNHTQTNGASTSYGAGIGVTGGNVVIDSCNFFGNNGSTVRGTDLYNNGGIVTVRYCTFSSSNNKIGGNSGTTTFSFSGNPSYSGSFSSGLTFVNTTSSPYIPNPQTAEYSGSCASSLTILPIELMDFNGVCEMTHTHLWWSTATEHNNDHFTIERAENNGAFYVLATMSGNMNTTQRTQYSYTDYNAEPGVNYYRLSQTDADGKERILKTISVENNCLSGKGLDISSWYDAQNNTVEIGYLFEHRQIVDAQIVNMMGQVVATTQLVLDPHERTAEMKLNETFSNGMYFLRLSNNSIQYSVKFMIGKQ